MGVVANTFIPMANLDMTPLMETLYATNRHLGSAKFTAMREGNSSISAVFGESYTGVNKTETGDAYSYDEADDYGTAETTSLAYLLVSDNGSLAIEGTEFPVDALVDNTKVDVDNLEYSSTWTHSQFSGENTDESTITQGEWYPCDGASSSIKWQHRSYTNAPTGHTSRAEGLLIITLVIRSKLTQTVVTTVNFEVRTKCYSQK